MSLTNTITRNSRSHTTRRAPSLSLQSGSAHTKSQQFFFFNYPADGYVKPLLKLATLPRASRFVHKNDDATTPIGLSPTTGIWAQVKVPIKRYVLCYQPSRHALNALNALKEGRAATVQASPFCARAVHHLLPLHPGDIPYPLPQQQ